MKRELFNIAFGKTGVEGKGDLKGKEASRFELNILGEELFVTFNVEDKCAKLADIVPLARMLSTKIALKVLDRLRTEGEKVPCGKGCSACCNYVVPLSIPEVFRLREEMQSMPEQLKDLVTGRCLDSAKQILDGVDEKFKANEVGEWYGGLGISCPFLADGLCLLYSQRPMACREHIVTGSAQFCEIGCAEDPKVVNMSVSVLESIGELAAELEGGDVEAVMLPFVFAWSEENKERGEQRWPVEVMIKKLIEILEVKAAASSAESVCITA